MGAGGEGARDPGAGIYCLWKAITAENKPEWPCFIAVFSFDLPPTHAVLSCGHSLLEDGGGGINPAWALAPAPNLRTFPSPPWERDGHDPKARGGLKVNWGARLQTFGVLEVLRHPQTLPLLSCRQRVTNQTKQRAWVPNGSALRTRARNQCGQLRCPYRYSTTSGAAGGR